MVNDFEKIINDAIINHVYKNEGLEQDLVNLLDGVLKKDNTTILLSKLIEDLLRSKVLYEPTFELTRKDLLLNNILKDKEIEKNLSGVF